ncbi:MAG: 2-isopropylmalate synthase, partial [Defluviitaleaceae bacterium]|nr:2-isopropylmalate synthase [Defluviitaleaceae bacterium]
KAPAWCSVDLRDGNQSIKTPMSLEKKLEFFKFLTETGFKEIEIGFPSASETEFQFARALIERGLIPDDVTVQVLTQSREKIIRRTFEALRGVRRAIVHLYNNTAPLWRQIVFEKTKDEIVEIAVEGANLLNEMAELYGPERFAFEYSPECFSQTEIEFSLEVCDAVMDAWSGRNGRIVNLPLTVESATPNVHADQVEYMCKNLANRGDIIVCLHAHNDRGTAVAATEFGLMAGADRVEGTLFGNGERTGNADIVTLALNLYSQGIDPGLDFSDIDKAIEVYELSTGIPVHPRHPYAGDLVYTSFSGGHQDAIHKGMKRMKERNGTWEVPYLPIDPRDVGRSFDPVIRFNSQSGKGGAAFILEHNYGITVPKKMQGDFGPKVIEACDANGNEMTPDEVYGLFKETYINLSNPVLLEKYSESSGEPASIKAVLSVGGETAEVAGEGGGMVDAFCNALSGFLSFGFEIKNYSQHAMESGNRSRAITYVEIESETASGKKTYFGAGLSGDIGASSLRAVVSAVNKALIDAGRFTR